jgi:hypothetical protein
MYDDCGKTGCAGGGSFIIILAPLWAICIPIVVLLAYLLVASFVSWGKGAGLKPNRPTTFDFILTVIIWIPVAYLVVKAWFKVGYYGAVFLAWAGL